MDYDRILTEEELFDLELLLNGGLFPITQYMSQLDYQNVIDRCKLENGKIYPMPINLTMNKEMKSGDIINLRLDEGTIIAKVVVEDSYPVEVERECLGVVKTTDDNHPYVKRVKSRKGMYYVGGPITKIAEWNFSFNGHRRSPEEVRKMLSSYKTVIGFQTRNPLHKCHVALMKYALTQVKDRNAVVLIHPVVGTTQPGDVDKYTRVRCYKHLLKRLPNKFKLSLLPLSMRMAGPREALWHAIIRRNYGCTHFVIGRDHAGPSTRRSDNGERFYGPMEAHDLIKKYKDELGIDVILSSEIVYVRDLDLYLPMSQVQEKNRNSIIRLSGTELRKRLKSGEEIPRWFSYSEIIIELRKCYAKKGTCYYIVGLCSSGKSTIAKRLQEHFQERGVETTLLDGDIVRTHLSKGLGFSKEDRSTNVRRIGFVASQVVKHGGVCICANIAPYREDREFNRRLIEKYGTYHEIFLDTPLEVCEQRDCKGLYKKARAGMIKKFTGISDPFERPTEQTLSIDTSRYSIPDTVLEILKHDFLTDLN